MKLRVTQSVLRNAIQGRGRHYAAKCAPRAKSTIVRHDEQYIGRDLGRHDAGRPPCFRLRGFFLDHAAELGIGWRELFAVNGSGRAGRAKLAGDLLCSKRSCYYNERISIDAMQDDSFNWFHSFVT